MGSRRGGEIGKSACPLSSGGPGHFIDRSGRGGQGPRRGCGGGSHAMAPHRHRCGARRGRRGDRRPQPEASSWSTPHPACPSRPRERVTDAGLLSAPFHEEAARCQRPGGWRRDASREDGLQHRAAPLPPPNKRVHPPSSPWGPCGQPRSGCPSGGGQVRRTCPRRRWASGGRLARPPLVHGRRPPRHGPQGSVPGLSTPSTRLPSAVRAGRKAQGRLAARWGPTRTGAAISAAKSRGTRAPGRGSPSPRRGV
jgi:hypothetical protein